MEHDFHAAYQWHVLIPVSYKFFTRLYFHLNGAFADPFIYALKFIKGAGTGTY
jgi:hypothetical protein